MNAGPALLAARICLLLSDAFHAADAAFFVLQTVCQLLLLAICNVTV